MALAFDVQYQGMIENLNPKSGGAHQGATERLWTQIEELTSEACILRKEGRDEEATVILSEGLPALLKDWAAISGLEPALRREKLRVLISDVQQRVDTAFLQRRLIVDELMLRLKEKEAVNPQLGLAKMANKTTQRFGLRRRIPIGDISGMIDAVNESISFQEREQLLPLRYLVNPRCA